MATGMFDRFGMLVAFSMLFVSFIDKGPSRFTANRCYSSSDDFISFNQLTWTRDNKCHKHFGYGKKALLDYFIHPSWHTMTKSSKIGGKRQVNGGDLIISICLLLSGDIHQCPGPERITQEANNTRGASRKSIQDKRIDTCLQVCMNFKDTTENLGDTLPDCRSSFCCPSAGALERAGARDLAAGLTPEMSRKGPGDPGERSARIGVGVDAAQRPKTNHSAEQAAIQETDFILDNIFSSKGLNVFHLNIRSLLPKISELRQLCINSKVGVFCFSETWLDDSIMDAEIEIENYVIVRRDRNRKGGGVCTYIRSDIGFNFRLDLNHDLIEAVWVDILLPKCKPILVGNCYRPPDQNNFVELLEELCSNCAEFSESEGLAQESRPHVKAFVCAVKIVVC